MIQAARADYEMRREMPATLQAADEFVLDFRQQSVALLDPVNSFGAELLLREALANAVLHGCHGDPRKQVRCRLRLKGERLIIAVGYEGDGFEWRVAWANRAEFPDCSGRGIEILRKYANRVRFNDKGNAVTIIKRFV